MFFLILTVRCFFEAGYEFRHDSTPTPEMLAKMLEKSPMSHVKKVKPSDCYS